MKETRRNSVLLCLALVALGVTVVQASASGGWTALFDGKTLNGWSIHSGFAKYEVVDKTIVGTVVKGSPNTFLCTDKQYGDFILEFEVKCDPALNSGVQIRSLIAPEKMDFVFMGPQGKPRQRSIPKDRVYGYQVEIAQAKTGTSGGIYDEARRAFFIADIRGNASAGKAFKDNAWNKYRIECKGSSIKTFVNGVPCADLKDSLTPRGIIGLQVHGVGRNFQPYQVRWRNIRIKEL